MGQCKSAGNHNTQSPTQPAPQVEPPKVERGGSKDLATQKSGHAGSSWQFVEHGAVWLRNSATAGSAVICNEFLSSQGQIAHSAVIVAVQWLARRLAQSDFSHAFNLKVDASVGEQPFAIEGAIGELLSQEVDFDIAGQVAASVLSEIRKSVLKIKDLGPKVNTSMKNTQELVSTVVAKSTPFALDAIHNSINAMDLGVNDSRAKLVALKIKVDKFHSAAKMLTCVCEALAQKLEGVEKIVSFLVGQTGTRPGSPDAGKGKSDGEKIVSLDVLSCEIAAFVSLVKVVPIQLDAVSSSGTALCKSIQDVINVASTDADTSSGARRWSEHESARKVLDTLADAATKAVDGSMSSKTVAAQLKDEHAQTSLVGTASELAILTALDRHHCSEIAPDEVQKEKSAVSKAIAAVISDFADYVEAKVFMLAGMLRGGNLVETVGLHHKDLIGMRFTVTVSMKTVLSTIEIAGPSSSRGRA